LAMLLCQYPKSRNDYTQVNTALKTMSIYGTHRSTVRKNGAGLLLTVAHQKNRFFNPIPQFPILGNQRLHSLNGTSHRTIFNQNRGCCSKLSIL